MNGEKITKTNQTKFLGVILDDKVTWKSHINSISAKVAKSVGVINRARKIFNRDLLLTLYHTMVQPYFYYCHMIWGTAFKTQIDQLVKLQKRAIRTISSLKKYDHTDKWFKELKIIKLPDLYEYMVVIFVFQFEKLNLPEVFSNYLLKNNLGTGPRPVTRNYEKYRMPRYDTRLGTGFIKKQGVIIGNLHYNLIMNCETVSACKNMMKKYIFNKY